MSRRYGMMVALLVLGIGIFVLGRSQPKAPVVHLAPPPVYRNAIERRLWNAMNHSLSTSGGEIYRIEPSPGHPARAIARLSESIGLLMVFALKAHDRRLFEQQIQVLNRAFVRHKLIAWEIVGDQQSTVDSTVDELRILQAMILAEREFPQVHLTTEIDRLAEGLKRHNAVGGWLLDSATAEVSHPKAAPVAVRYWNVSALDALAQIVPGYRRLAYQARLGLVHSQNRWGWYALTYNPIRHTYQFGGPRGLNMDDELITALHAQTAGIPVTAFVTAIRTLWLKHGIIPLAVSAEGRICEPGVSPAVYAMAVRLLLNAGQENIAQAVAQRLWAMQDAPHLAPGSGGFSAVLDGRLYSFTQLEVLLTLQEVPIGH